MHLGRAEDGPLVTESRRKLQVMGTSFYGWKEECRGQACGNSPRWVGSGKRPGASTGSWRLWTSAGGPFGRQS